MRFPRPGYNSLGPLQQKKSLGPAALKGKRSWGGRKSVLIGGQKE
jgi:hypothetical protein